MIRARDRQPKRRHVLQRLAIKAIELLVAATDLQHRLQPVRECLGVARSSMVVDTLVRCSEDPVAILQRIEQAAMPGFTRLEVDFEAQPAIGILDFAPAIAGVTVTARTKSPLR